MTNVLKSMRNEQDESYLIIYNPENSDAWLQSDYTVEDGGIEQQ